MKRRYGILIAIIFFISGLLLGKGAVVPDPISVPQSGRMDVAEQTVNFILDFDEEQLRTFPQIRFTEGETVWEVLNRTMVVAGIALHYKDYGDMGVFLEGIDGAVNTGDTYWQYWINGQYAEVGASAYHLQPGDTILWKLTKSRQ